MIVLDTHALVWWVSRSERLRARARGAIADALRKGPVTASAISFFEIATSVRRGRLDLGLPLAEWQAEVRKLAELRIEPVSVEIAQVAGGFQDDMPGDPADRIIAATALVLHARLITADAYLRKHPRLQTIW
ncbi:MAG: type II toxin-antitoxin system VapC family toxin [Betaproteobacteria bacterium]